MATSPRLQSLHQHGQMPFLGRLFAVSCLLIGVFLAWTQQYEYKNMFNEDGKSTPFFWQRGIDVEDTTTEQETTLFSCKIDQLDLHLPRAPDLIVAGAAKCGTTTLAHWLLDHPNVLPTKKWECHFFTTGIHPREFEPLLRENNDNQSSSSSSSSNHQQTKEDIICQLRKRYIHQWPDLSSTSTTTQSQEPVYTFDKTPDYLYPSRVPKLIHVLFAEASHRPKIVVLLRNPIDRAYSHYRMGQRMMREEHVLFEDFVKREINLLQELGLTDFSFMDNSNDSPTDDNNNMLNNNSQHNQELSLEQMDELYDQVSDQLKGHNYLSRGLYAMQLERWFRHGLGPDILVLPYSQLASQPDEVYASLLEFVGMPPHTLSDELRNQRFNYNDAVTEPLSNLTRLQLAKFYQQSNQDLIDLLEKHNKSLNYDWRELLV